MNEPLRVLIIGGGDMGKRHLQAFSAMKDVAIAGIAESDPERATVLAKHEAVEAVYHKYEEALEALKPDIVSVCLPAFLHASVSIAALEAGAYVLCEKPIALDEASAKAMIAASDAHNNRLGIIMQRRWSSLWQAAGHRRETLGSPLFYFCSDFRSVRPKAFMHDKQGSGGPVIDCAVHDFDMCIAWFGPAQSVYATASALATGKEAVDEVEELAVDTALITVRFAAGYTAQINYGWGMPPGFAEQVRNEIAGPDGLLKLYRDRIAHHYPDGSIQTIQNVSADDGHEAQIRDFVQAVRDGSTLPIAPRDAWAAATLSHCALASVASGEVVTVPEL